MSDKIEIRTVKDMRKLISEYNLATLYRQLTRENYSESYGWKLERFLKVLSIGKNLPYIKWERTYIE